MGVDLRSEVEACMPYTAMTLNQLCLSVYITLLHSVLDPSRGVSATILVLYEHLLSAALLSSLALLFERGKRPRPSFRILCGAFFVGLLQIPMGQLLFTASLKYITVSFQSVAMNMIPVVVFVLAVASRRERFQFWGLYGQAKLWGVLASAAGATVMVVLSDPERHDSDSLAGAPANHARLFGCLMVALAVLANASGYLLVERLAMKYPANLTLSALMNTSGAFQTAIFALLTERNTSSWKIMGRGSLLLFTILYGGTVITGLLYCVSVWCIHKKGPVFGSAFYPLLIVFCFLLETIILGKAAHLESIVGAMLVVGGLYLLLWAKSKDNKMERTIKGGQSDHADDLSAEPLLLS